MNETNAAAPRGPTRAIVLLTGGLVIASVPLLGGCPGGIDVRTPESALASFAAALRRGDAATAYSLTSESYRRSVSRAQFEEWMRRDPEELRRVVEELEHPAGPPEEEAIVEIGEHEHVRLVHDPAGWRVATDVVDYYSQATARQALLSFVRAIEHRRWDVVLRLVPEADRDGMTSESMRERWEGEGREEVERLAAGIRASLEGGAPIEENGDHAVMPWGERYRAQLVREAGAWRIEDPD